MHDFFVFDYNQKLQVSVSDVGRWGSPRFLGTTKKRRISELLCWGGVCNGSVQMNLHELPKNTEVSLGAVTLHIEWLEIIPHSVDYDEGLLQFHIDEVFVPEDVKMDQIALSVRVGEEQLRTPLVRLKGGEAAEQDGKTRQSISRTQSIFQVCCSPVARACRGSWELQLPRLDESGNKMKMQTWLSSLLFAFLLLRLDAATLRLRRTKMTSAELRMSARMKAMAPEKATLANMEASVLNMAKLQSERSDSAATNLTAFLKEIQQLIDNSMKKNILLRMNQTQIDVDQAWANLTSCSHPNDTKFVEELADLDAKHVQCRQTEADLYANFQTTCVVGWQIYVDRIHALCNVYMQAQQLPSPTSTCVMQQGTPVPTIGNYLKGMAAHFKGEYETVVDKRLKCQNASATPFADMELCKQMMCHYWDTRLDCSKKQAVFEQRACELHRTYTCSKFAECYSEKVEIYEDIDSLAKQTEVAAKAEWRTVQRIECYISALSKPGDELSAAIDECKGKLFPTKPVELVYKGPAPAAKPCAEVYLQPGSAVFSASWYHAAPPHAPAESCTSSCCMDGTFSPAYPPGLPCPYEAKGEIETILRMPVSRLALETQSLEIAALNDKGQVVARHAFQLHHLVRAPMRAISFEPCNMHMEDQSDQRISAEVQVRLMGLHRVKHKDAIKRLAIKVTADDASSDTETSQDEGEESVALVDRSFSLQWVNFIYGKLHPKISVIIARMMEDRFGLITQMLQARLPGPLKDIHFKYFRLGDTPPAFGPITVAETLRGHRSAGIEMQVGFQLDTNAHMELSVHGANLGIDRIRVQGQLLVRLGPLLEEVPVLGGIVACFLNPPDLELQYCGVAHCVESTMLANRFQKMVDVGLASALVLPHVFSVPIGTEGQAVDRALLAHPKPIGVLRVTAVRATNLREGWPLKRSRSPYLSLSLAGEEWQTSAVWSSLNPEWDETHDFLVYDKRQTLGIEIVDTNSLFLRKVIGYADPILATDTEAHSEIPLALFDCPESSNTPKAASHPRHPAGNVELRLDWLNFVRHGRKGPDGFCVLRVKFDEVEVPTQLVDLRSTSELDPLRVRMCASIGKVKKSTPEVAWFKRDPTQQDPRTIELDIENVLYMLIHKTDLDSGTLELELLDGHDKVLGSSSLELHKELEATGHAVWNNQRPHRRLPLRHGTGRPCLADVDVSFQGLRSSGDVSQPVGTTPSSPHV
eukprot:s2505_g1.t2